MRWKVWACGWLVVAAWAAGAARGQEWTRFRGPNGTGIGQGDKIPLVPVEKDYRWKVKLPAPGHSSPVLWGDKIFLTCAPKDGKTRQVVCLHQSDGRVLWTWKDAYTPYKQNRLNSFAASTAAVDADRVYLAWVSGIKFMVVALDHGGKLAWRREVGDFTASHGAGASPIVLGDTVIVGNTHQGMDSFMLGLDAKTGTIRWKRECNSGPTSYITPTVYHPPGGTPQVILVSSRHGVSSLDPATGKVLWEEGGPFQLKSVASPVVAGGLVFASAGQGGPARESAVIRPPSAPGGKAKVAYRLGRFVPYVPTPIAVGEYLYVLSDRNNITCIEPATGKQVWQESIGGTYYPSPVCVNGRIYCINTKGAITVLAPGPTFKVLAKGALPEGTHATPAIANGRMYLRTFHHLICVGK